MVPAAQICCPAMLSMSNNGGAGGIDRQAEMIISEGPGQPARNFPAKLNGQATPGASDICIYESAGNQRNFIC